MALCRPLIVLGVHIPWGTTPWGPTSLGIWGKEGANIARVPVSLLRCIITAWVATPSYHCEREGLANARTTSCSAGMPLNAKIVAANFFCSAKVVFVKKKRWICQSTEALCNALVSVLRLYSKVDRLLTAIT